MIAIVRILLAIAAPIAVFFVGRDAFDLGLVQALIVMIFISTLVVVGAWRVRRWKI